MPKECTCSRVIVFLVTDYLSALCVLWPKVSRNGLPLK